MLHLLIDPIDAEKKPWDLFVLAFFITLICINLGYYVLGHYDGIGSVIILTLAFFPLLYKAFSVEEQRDLKLKREGDRFYAHRKIVVLFSFIFLGVVLGYFANYLFLPSDLGETLFADQVYTIQHGSTITGSAVSSELALKHILKTNFTLLGICLVLSLLFGLGALFLLVWNGSVMGIAMGLFAQQNMTSGFASATLMSALRYLVHGLPEMIAFFLASMGGSILCIAVLHHDLQGKKGKKIFKDGIALVCASIGLLFLSALIEVFITPFFF